MFLLICCFLAVAYPYTYQALFPTKGKEKLNLFNKKKKIHIEGCIYYKFDMFGLVTDEFYISET